MSRMTEQQTVIADEVRVALVRAKVKYSALAEHLGLTRSAMSRRMSGETPFTAQEIASTADFLGIPVERLYGRDAGNARPAAVLS